MLEEEEEGSPARGGARGLRAAHRRLPAPGGPAGGQDFVNIFTKFCSFSAVSALIFASKYAFYSIFQNLPDFLAENFEIWQNFANFATFAKFC